MLFFSRRGECGFGKGGGGFISFKIELKVSFYESFISWNELLINALK